MTEIVTAWDLPVLRGVEIPLQSEAELAQSLTTELDRHLGRATIPLTVVEQHLDATRRCTVRRLALLHASWPVGEVGGSRWALEIFAVVVRWHGVRWERKELMDEWYSTPIRLPDGSFRTIDGPFSLGIHKATLSNVDLSWIDVPFYC